CADEIKAQNGLGGITLDNNSGKVLVTAKTEKIAHTVTNDGFLCPLTSKGNFTDGKYTGSTEESGTNEGSADAIEVLMSVDLPLVGRPPVGPGRARPHLWSRA